VDWIDGEGGGEGTAGIYAAVGDAKLKMAVAVIPRTINVVGARLCGCIVLSMNVCSRRTEGKYSSNADMMQKRCGGLQNWVKVIIFVSQVSGIFLFAR
jgi:hypothetical protein